jgi:hypothetical protein
MLNIPEGADQSCKVFLCLEFGYQKVHTGKDTFTAVCMAQHVLHINHFHKYVLLRMCNAEGQLDWHITTAALQYMLSNTMFEH